MLIQRQHELTVKTRGPGFTNISNQLRRWLEDITATDGVVTAFVRHTSASLTIQENADPDVLADLTDALNRLAPQSHNYRHACEGPDDMPAHIKTMLSATSLAIPVQDGRAIFGTWQGLYLIEHRARAHKRDIFFHYIGEQAG